jgi:hypothetical protein
VVDLVERCLGAQLFGVLRPAEDIADVLVAFVDGVGLQSLVYPELVSAARVEHLLDEQLSALGLQRSPESQRSEATKT